MPIQKRLFIFVLSFFLTSCIEDITIVPWGTENTFYIDKGAHYSSPRRPSFSFPIEEGLHFSAILEADTEYDVGPENQINKLMGFSDCGDDHMKNSARIGWMYTKGEMLVLPYVHRAGKTEYDLSNPLLKVKLGKRYRYKIEVSGQFYVFSAEDENGQWISQIKDRGCESAKVGTYALQPYFGGTHTAPHDMTIRIGLE